MCIALHKGGQGIINRLYQKFSLPLMWRISGIKGQEFLKNRTSKGFEIKKNGISKGSEISKYMAFKRSAEDIRYIKGVLNYIRKAQINQ